MNNIVNKLLVLIMAIFMSGCSFEAPDETPPTIEISLDAQTTDTSDDSPDNSSGIGIDVFTELELYNRDANQTKINEYLYNTDFLTISDNLDQSIRLLPAIIKNSSGTIITSVDTSVIGEYTIEYTAVDSANNNVIATRGLRISDKRNPQINISIKHEKSSPTDEWPVNNQINPEVSIVMPLNVEIKKTDLVHGVTTEDILFYHEGVPNRDQTDPILTTEILASPRDMGDNILFDLTGDYKIKYTATDTSDNVSTDIRWVKVIDDTESPSLNCSVNLVIEPLGTTEEEDTGIEGGTVIKVNEDEKAELLRKIAEENITVIDNVFPYTVFSYQPGTDDTVEAEPGAEVDDTADTQPDNYIRTKILETHDLFKENFTDEKLVAATLGNPIIIPMVVFDASNPYDKTSPDICFRKVEIKDVTPPTLFGEVPAGYLNLEVDNTLSVEGIKEKIILISSNPADPDNFVSFVDEGTAEINLEVESIYKLVSGVRTEILNVDAGDGSGLLDYQTLILLQGVELFIVFTANDGYNYASDKEKSRTRSLVLSDTTKPNIKFGQIEDGSEDFLTFELDASQTTVEHRKQFMLESGMITVSDNGSYSLDISISAKLIDQVTGSITGIEANLATPGEYKVAFSAVDQNNNQRIYGREVSVDEFGTELEIFPYKEVTIYVYDSESKEMFDSLVTSTTDEYGNVFSAINPGLTYQLGGYDMSQLIGDLESITTNTDYDSTYTAQKYWEIPETETILTDPATSVTKALKIDYSSIRGDFINYYEDLDGKAFLYFTKPSRIRSYDSPITGINEVAGTNGYYQNIGISVVVGNYAEHIKMPIQSMPYDNQIISNLVIVVAPKFVAPEFISITAAADDYPERISSNIVVEKNAGDLYDRMILETEKFMTRNYSGLYLSNPAVYTPNDLVKRSGVVFIEVDNSYEFVGGTTRNQGSEVRMVDYMLDSNGDLKQFYDQMISDEIIRLLGSNDGLKNRIVSLQDDPANPGVNSHIDLKDFAMTLSVIDADLKVTEKTLQPKPIVSTETHPVYININATGNESHMPANAYCSDSELFLRETRNMDVYDYLCRFDGNWFAPNGEQAGQADGEIGVSGSGGQVLVYVTIPGEVTDENPEPADLTGFCPISFPFCPSPDPTPKDAIRLVEKDSDAYKMVTELPYEIASSINFDSNIYNIDGGVLKLINIKSGSDVEVGDFISRIAKQSLLPMNLYTSYIKDEKNVLMSSEDEDPQGVIHPYTFRKENLFSFTSKGLLNGTEILSNPSNMSAYDLMISGAVEPINISYSRLIGSKYSFNQKLTVLGDDHNKNFIKIDINPNEYFLIEKRAKENGDDIVESVGSTYLDTDGVRQTEGWLNTPENLEQGIVAEGILIWHVEELGINTTVATESGVNRVFGAGDSLIPSGSDDSSVISTNDNSGVPTGLIIHIEDDYSVSICHEDHFNEQCQLTK